MIKVVNKDGYVELVTVVICSAIGILALIGIIELFKHLPEKPEPVYRTTVIVKKDIREIGMSCYKLIFTHCDKEYGYFINDKKVSEDRYNNVQEGKTYLCTEDYRCKELENE